MNQTQTKYAKERAAAIYNRKRTEVQNKYRPEPLTPKERVKALVDGSFSVNPELMKNTYSWADSIVFNDEKKIDREAQENELKVLKEQYDKIADEIILGDNEEAIKLLREFENA